MNAARSNLRRSTSYGHARRRRPNQGAILVLLAIMLTMLIGLLGLVIDGGLLLASRERAQNIADSTARSVAIALHSGAETNELQGIGETFAFAHNRLPEDDDMTRLEQLIVNHPPSSGWFAGNENYVEVIVTHPMDTNFIQVLGTQSHRHVGARAVAGFRSLPRDAGLVILGPRANPGLTVSGTNANLDVDSAILVYTRREGENEFGATVGQYHAGQPAVTVDGSGATILADDGIWVSGGVDDYENYMAPNVPALHAGTWDPVYDPFHDVQPQLPIPIIDNGVIDRDLGSVSITTGSQSGLVEPNSYDESTGVTTLNPGIYHEIDISGGEVVLMPGIYVLQHLKGGGNILSITGGVVTGDGVMFYNTGETWNPVDGGADVGDLAVPSETSPFGVAGTQFGGIDIHAENVTLTPIDSGVFAKMVIYQRRFNDAQINITNGRAPPLGIKGRFYAKWANLKISGQGTYNFAIVAESMSVNGRATVIVPEGIPLPGQIEPVRLVE